MKDILKQNKASWDAIADSFFGMTALPTYGCSIPTEKELLLFPNLRGKKVLDIGCGSGHSLKWCADNGAAELWGVDLSTKQIENAQHYLTESGHAPKLFNAPMETDCGLPKNYFDVVYSIYAIGWTLDLPKTLDNIASYLKTGGTFVFSWDHPLMRHINYQDEKLVFESSYLNEDIFSFEKGYQPFAFKLYKMSSYINAIANAGFMVERLIEETDSETLSCDCDISSAYYAPCKAKMSPLSFIIKARKI